MKPIDLTIGLFVNTEGTEPVGKQKLVLTVPSEVLEDEDGAALAVQLIDYFLMNEARKRILDILLAEMTKQNVTTAPTLYNHRGQGIVVNVDPAAES